MALNKNEGNLTAHERALIDKKEAEKHKSPNIAEMLGLRLKNNTTYYFSNEEKQVVLFFNLKPSNTTYYFSNEEKREYFVTHKIQLGDPYVLINKGRLKKMVRQEPNMVEQ